MKNYFLDNLLTLLFVAATSFMIYTLLVLISENMSMPDVHWSHSQGSCVQVLNYDEKNVYTCENLPLKYNHIWVK